MGWIIALAILVGLAILPLGASVQYDSAGAVIRLIAGPLRFKVYPSEKKSGKKKEKKPDKKEEKASAPAAKKKSGGSITDFFPLVQVALDFVRTFFRKLRVNRLELKIILAGGDPCDLALNYGRAWAAMGNLIPLLEEHLVIKKRDTQVECDFTADATTIYARADLTITLGRIISLVVRYGIRALREFIKINNLRKGGAVK